MPVVPTREALGADPNIEGATKPAEINPSVAYDTGRAGQAWAHALQTVAHAFETLAERKNAVEDDAWLAERKIALLKADNEIRSNTELNADVDGSGFDGAPQNLKLRVDQEAGISGGSEAAKAKFRLWSTERLYETGKWAVDSAQKRLRQSTLSRLDTRLDELTNLASVNPEKAVEYQKAYEEEVTSVTGKAIDLPTASEAIRIAKSNISRSALLAKIKKNPEDLGKALKALENSGVSIDPRAEGPKGSVAKQISGKLETGKDSGHESVANISPDAGGTKSYGTFGLNTGGSAQQFVREYGSSFGFTARPGTDAFDKQWKNAAAQNPNELHAAEMEWHNKYIVAGIEKKLTATGVSPEVAGDVRVRTYFADRLVQYGPESIKNHSARIGAAFQESGGDPVKFLKVMSGGDLEHLEGDFPTAIATGVYGPKGHFNRVKGRLRLSLQQTGVDTSAPSQAEAAGVSLESLPKVSGSIQPSDLMSLDPKHYQALVNEIRPFVGTEIETRVQDAIAANLTKGSQSIITEQQLDDAATIVGPKAVEKWREQLRASADQFSIMREAKSMTPEQRMQHLLELTNGGDIEGMSREEFSHYQRWQQTVIQMETQIRKDPLGWFATQHEAGKQAMELLRTAPQGQEGIQQREKAVDTLIKLQLDEGIGDRDVHVLHGTTATKIANAINTAKNGNQAAAILHDLRLTYGKHMPRVWGEIVNAGAPSELLAMGTASPAGQNNLIDAITFERAVADSGGKGANPQTIMTERAGVKKTDVAKAVSNNVSEFLTMLDPSSVELHESYRKAAEKLTLYHMINGNKSVEAAAKQASIDLMYENYGVIRGTLVPKHIYENSYWTARGGLSHIGVLILNNRDNVVKNYSDRINPKDKEYFDGTYINRLAADVKLVPAGENGVYLLDQYGRRVMINTKEGPKPWIIGWDKILSLGGVGFTND